MGVRVENLKKQFKSIHGTHAAVRSVNFEIPEGSLTALLGPSGSGKSTILRMIGGLEKPDSGDIFLNGENVTDLSVQKRGIGFVFQNYALFKHMKVKENIAFGLRIQKRNEQETQERVEELLNLLGLAGLGERYPHQLSGGQRQRVALARALAPQPKVLLLDEPFGAIDAKIREELREWLRRLHDDIHVTSVFVTHDQEEALEICDQIIVLNHGQVEQVGSPELIYNHPKTEFVANFVGSMNILPAKYQDSVLQMGPYTFTQNHWTDFEEGDEIKVFFRPQDIYLSSKLNTYALKATLTRISFLGVNMKVELLSEEGSRFFAIIPHYIYHRENLHEGARVSYQIEEISYINTRLGKEIKKLLVSDYEI